MEEAKEVAEVETVAEPEAKAEVVVLTVVVQAEEVRENRA